MRRKISLASMQTRYTEFYKMSTFCSMFCSVLANFISDLDKFWSPTNSHVDFDFVIHHISILHWWNRLLSLCCHKQYLTSWGLRFFFPQLIVLGDWRNGLPTVCGIQLMVFIQLFQTRAIKPSSQGSWTTFETQTTASSLSASILWKHSHNHVYTFLQSMPKNVNKICGSFPVSNSNWNYNTLVCDGYQLFFSHLMVLPQAIIF